MIDAYTDHDDYMGREDYDYGTYAEEDDYDEGPDAEEWRPGECDRCYGGDETGVTATSKTFGPVYCACRIGQGAAPQDCRCGPPTGIDF